MVGEESKFKLIRVYLDDENIIKPSHKRMLGTWWRSYCRLHDYSYENYWADYPKKRIDEETGFYNINIY